MGTRRTKAQATAERVAAVLEGNYVIDNPTEVRREYWQLGVLKQTLDPAMCHPSNPYGTFFKPYPISGP